jgi:hypothetical protein
MLAVLAYYQAAETYWRIIIENYVFLSEYSLWYRV